MNSASLLGKEIFFLDYSFHLKKKVQKSENRRAEQILLGDGVGR
jgi:hypothetical protein